MFDRANVLETALQPIVAHGGEGRVLFCRIAERQDLAGKCRFVDVAVIPPGASIGKHEHSSNEEEFYLVLEGTGLMWRDGEEWRVRPGDLIRNRPGGTHGLVNDGQDSIRIFVFEVET